MEVIWNKSQILNIPNNSVDAVITDPPYGSNVHISRALYNLVSMGIRSLIMLNLISN